MSIVDKAAATAKEIAREDIVKAREIAIETVNSGVYLYPIKGVFYFITHPPLWKPLASKLIPTLILSVAVLAFMFIFTYLPQMTILFFTSGPLAPFSTILLILSESSTIITLVSKTFIIREALDETFDAVLLNENESGLVANGREVKTGNDPISRLGRVFTAPFHNFTPKAIIRYIMYLPLNFIPVVGTIMFLFLQGKSRGSYAHARYFQLKNMSPSRQEAFVVKHALPYSAFGIVASLLEMIPIASIFFSFTNSVGAALWAADIEKNETGTTETTEPNLGLEAEKDE